MDLLVLAFIFLAAGVIAVPIASRLGLGSVLGYLLAGVLIGPYTLGLITDAKDLMHFAEFGVVIMLFLIGLELRPNLLWRMRNAIIGLGGLQVIGTTAAFTCAALLLGLDGKTALAIGLILSLSSTALALQILDEKGQRKTQSGRSSFAVLLFQDIAVIPILAFLPLLAMAPTEDGDVLTHSAIAHLPAAQQALIIIGSVFALILVGRYLSRPLFRYIANGRQREIFTASALLIVVSISLLMNLVGLSPALGAFISGVVLANNEYRHEIETSIDPFKALLLGLFFMTVGAGMDFHLLAEKPGMIIGIVTGLIVIKFIVLMALSWFFKIRRGHRYWFAFSLAQGGEFGFVLLSFSSQNRILGGEMIDTLTAAIAFSMALTPILILLNEKWIQPRFTTQNTEDELDEVLEQQDSPVIVAGFGRFGQVVARLLMANGIQVTVLDNSGSQIERFRRFGFKVFYGDANRPDLMRTAGAEQAQVLIVAVDSKERISSVIQTAKKHFPNLKIYTRAYDVVHYHELEKLGVDHIEREVFRGSLKVGELALRELGMRAYQARRMAHHFALHDQQTIDRLGQHKDDSLRYISEVKRAQEEIVNILQADKDTHHTRPDKSWDAAPPD